MYVPWNNIAFQLDFITKLVSGSSASERIKKNKLKEHENMLFIVLFLAVLLLVILWQIDVRLKLKLSYAAAVQIPGAYMYPLVGNLFQILFLNPEETFRFMRSNATFHKKSNRFWIFGVLHYNAIKAVDIEVSVIRIASVKPIWSSKVQDCWIIVYLYYALYILQYLHFQTLLKFCFCSYLTARQLKLVWLFFKFVLKFNTKFFNLY